MNTPIEEAFENAHHLAVISNIYYPHILVPLGEDGAILSWIFSNPAYTVIEQILIKLTEDEAQLVWDTDHSSVGMIENVRSTLTHPEAVIRVAPSGHPRCCLPIAFWTGAVGNGEVFSEDFLIDTQVSEDEFCASLQATAHKIALDSIPDEVLDFKDRQRLSIEEKPYG